jgi:hypothetical protein
MFGIATFGIMYGNPQLLTSGYDFHGSPYFCYATWRLVMGEHSWMRGAILRF